MPRSGGLAVDDMHRVCTSILLQKRKEKKNIIIVLKQWFKYLRENKNTKTKTTHQRPMDHFFLVLHFLISRFQMMIIYIFIIATIFRMLFIF
jgi:hypothetical protein